MSHNTAKSVKMSTIEESTEGEGDQLRVVQIIKYWLYKNTKYVLTKICPENFLDS